MNLTAHHPSVATLRGLPLFAALPEDELAALSGVLELGTAPPGRQLEAQDVPVRAWRLLVCGHAVIQRDATPIGLAGRGDSWSEHCLLHDLRSPIAVVALSPVALLSATREEFFALPDEHPVLAGRLVARSAASADRLALPVRNALRHLSGTGAGLSSTGAGGVGAAGATEPG